MSEQPTCAVIAAWERRTGRIHPQQPATAPQSAQDGQEAAQGHPDGDKSPQAAEEAGQ